MLKRRAFLNFSSIRHAPPSGYLQHVSRTAMACRFEVTLPLEDQSGVSAARQALDEVGRLEDQLASFRESSGQLHQPGGRGGSGTRRAIALFALATARKRLLGLTCEAGKAFHKTECQDVFLRLIVLLSC